jgi:transcriptional regulator with XRE-family HTH domain
VRVPHPAKAVIVARGERQCDVADAVGIKPASLSLVLNRRVASWPAIRTRLSEYLGLPESELFLNDDECVQ